MPDQELLLTGSSKTWRVTGKDGEDSCCEKKNC